MKIKNLIIGIALMSVSIVSAIKAVDNKQNKYCPVIEPIVINPSELYAQNSEEQQFIFEEHCSKCQSGVFRARVDDPKNEKGLNCTFCGFTKPE
jgi:ribosomal protein S27AE